MAYQTRKILNKINFISSTGILNTAKNIHSITPK